MAEDKNDKKVEDVKEEDFFNDVLDDPEEDDNEKELDDKGDGDIKDDTDDEEKERSQKNKDAEEARKRREAEEKAKKALEEKKAKEAEEAKKKTDVKEKQTQTLGKQLDKFKEARPDVDLKSLDDDKSFKKFINGKLLGKQDFTELYDEYVEVRAEMSGKSSDEVETNYKTKANASSGSTKSKTAQTTNDVYSEKEYNRIVAKLPLMSDEEAEGVMGKLDRSTDFYNKK
ncbi:MAG: hypothetical protein PF513_03140 [Tenericutes bacterium]|jgi:hypothetical protein|nr:hypothetical protein [Mycoplasmatota bacterium]